MALLDQLQQLQVGNDPTSQGIAALPAGGDGTVANYTAPATTNDTSANDSGYGNIDIGSAISTAAQSPDLSKGLLGAFADKLSSVGSKLSNLSPAASQGLLATGLGILAANNGQNNLSQIIGLGGISGVNAYNDAKAMQAQQQQQQLANQFKAQQLYQSALAAKNTNDVAQGNLAVNQQNAATKAAAVQAGLTGVARTVQTQDANGNTYTIQLDKNGNQVGAPILKSSTYTGPLSDANQKTVNDANTAAATAAQNLTKTQGYLQRLSPTITDPNTGQQVQNPNYVNITGGAGSAY